MSLVIYINYILNVHENIMIKTASQKAKLTYTGISHPTGLFHYRVLLYGENEVVYLKSSKPRPLKQKSMALSSEGRPRELSFGKTVHTKYHIH